MPSRNPGPRDKLAVHTRKRSQNTGSRSPSPLPITRSNGRSPNPLPITWNNGRSPSPLPITRNLSRSITPLPGKRKDYSRGRVIY